MDATASGERRLCNRSSMKYQRSLPDARTQPGDYPASRIRIGILASGVNPPKLLGIPARAVPLQNHNDRIRRSYVSA
jgi:hypothetical protein